MRTALSAIARVLDWFIPEPLRQSTALYRRAQMYLVAHLLGPPFGLSLCALAYFWFFYPGPPDATLWIVAGGFVVFATYPALIKLTGRLTILAPFSVVQTTFLVLLGAAEFGGVNSPFLIWIAVVPLVAAFYVQGRPALRAAVLLMTAGQLAAFYALLLSGHGLDQPVPLASLDTLGMISIFCTFVFVWIMSAYYARVVAVQQVEIERELDERRRTEAKLRRAMEEAERAHALEAQLQHSQRLEAVGTLAGGMAHEINNALVPVIALTTMVARQLPEGSRQRRNLETVLSGAERSRDLVKRILSFSRKEEPRRESFDLASVLRDALGMMRASLPATIRLKEDILAGAALDGDPTQFHQVVVNLLNNAAQAIGEAMGTISVRLERAAADGSLLLSVADTGCGMDEATRARLFEPFFTTKEVGSGTGLGLAIVRGIVEGHGGRIAVETAPGRGSRFVITLPARAPAMAVGG